MKEDPWLKTYWRPAIAWQYLIVCVCDFIIFPSVYMYIVKEPWDPLTLKEGGFYHLAMAAIIGVAAWTRGQEKITQLIDGSEQREIITTTQTPIGRTDKRGKS
jgi:hypothetical protein